MSDPYNRVKAGRLTFKGGSVATLNKSIDKKSKKNKKNKLKKEASFSEQAMINTQKESGDDFPDAVEPENVYTIDAAKKMSYQELFPVEAKKFGYEAKDKDKAKAKAQSSVEEALDDRVKKKADRYCK